MAYLLLIRHGKSEYNAKGLWTGHADPPLNEEGEKEAENVAKHLEDIPVDYAYSSTQKRAEDTLKLIKQTLQKDDLITYTDPAINERDYGVYTGKNKWEVKEQIGTDAFMKLRRGWDFPIPEGESLRQVSERTVPFFEKEILPKLCDGKNVLIVSSGNALRTIIKYLEKISDENVSNIEFATGEAFIYEVSPDGKVIHKEVRAHHRNTV